MSELAATRDNYTSPMNRSWLDFSSQKAGKMVKANERYFLIFNKKYPIST